MLEVAELERRMRPGAWSHVGFLGETESLNDVLATDERTLSELGVACDEIAETLSLLIRAPDAGLPPLPPDKLAGLKDACRPLERKSRWAL